MKGDYLKCSVCVYVHLLYVLPTSMEPLSYFYSVSVKLAIHVVEEKVVAGKSVEDLHKTSGGSGGIGHVLMRFC